jgi:hypothetical protein
MLLAAVWTSGCAHRPPPLPGVTPGELPGAWLDELAAAPCIPGLQARLKMRVDAEGEPAVRVDGTLAAVLPDTLKVTARLGAFRPLFVLHARADSAGLLFHEERAYWISSRGNIDWDRMNPSAWARALQWSLCPQALARELVATGPGRMEDRIWQVEGTIPGHDGTVRLHVDPRSRAVVGIDLLEDKDLVARARLRNYRYLGEFWIPTLVDLEVPQPQGRLELRVEILAPGLRDGRDFGEVPMLRPPGWTQVHPDRAPSIHVAPLPGQ